MKLNQEACPNSFLFERLLIFILVVEFSIWLTQSLYLVGVLSQGISDVTDGIQLLIVELWITC